MMSVKEYERFAQAKLLVTEGITKLAINRAARKLGCSTRTIQRDISAYKAENWAYFEHGNKGRPPVTTIKSEVKEFVLDLYVNVYHEANVKHFVEILKEDYDIVISDSTIHTWIKELYIVSPKARRITVRLNNKKIKALAQTPTMDKIEEKKLEDAAIILDAKEAHPHRSRSAFMGEMIQMDASEFYFVNYEKWTLHLAIDDATNEVVGAYLDKQETLNGYYHVLYQILKKYGIPAMFYTDRRTVFEYESLAKVNKTSDKDTYTQFKNACIKLGIDIKTTSTAQAKGRIERANQTFQVRLPIDLKRAKLDNSPIEEVNTYIETKYLDYFNSKFSLKTENDVKTSIFVQAPDDETINTTLAVISGRKIDRGHCIKFDNAFYKPVNKTGTWIFFQPKTSCFFIKAFDGGFFLNVKDKLYALVKVEDRKKESEEFVTVVEPKEQKEAPKYYKIPKLPTTWTLNSFRRYYEEFPDK